MGNAPKSVDVNCETGEVTERLLTADEIAEIKQLEIEAQARRMQEETEAQAKAEAKASALAKLTTLGLTEDEAKAIAG